MHTINRRRFVALSGTAGIIGAGAFLPVRAQSVETLPLTIGSSLPISMAWTAPTPTLFMEEVNRRLQSTGSRYRIKWQDSWGGALYKPAAGAQAVGQGTVDLGYVWTNIEGARFPLAQVSLVTPYATDDCVAVAESIQDIYDRIEPMRAEWTRNNITLLAPTAVDTYHLYTKTPIRTMADLKGKRITAVGAIGLWINQTGAVHVNGNLGSWYTDVQTGVADGVVIMSTGSAMIRIWEVAPHLTLLGMGAHNNGGLAINNDTLAKLPPDVATVVKAVGREYTKRSAQSVMAHAATDMTMAREVGAKLSPPLTINDFTGSEKQKLVASTPDLAGAWIKENEAKGLPARQILKAYMDGLVARGAKPLRNWA